MANFITHLESTTDGSRFDPRTLHTLHGGRPLLVRYDLDRLKKSIRRASIGQRPADMWRYRELLPVVNFMNRVSIAERLSPLARATNLGAHLGIRHLYVKDESKLPTGSFKSRGMAVAITMARQFGIKRVALPTAGNAGMALAAYARQARIGSYIFMPLDGPAESIEFAIKNGAHVFLVDGLISDCGQIAEAGEERMRWFNMATLREPYRLEGKKTMGFELAEQLGWRLPDVIVYPTGGGTGLIGMWKAFEELAALGWIDAEHRPRMVAVQSDGCCPLVRAFESGAEECSPFQNATTMAAGLRVPYTIGDRLVLKAIRESNGTAVTVEEQRISDWMRLGSEMEEIDWGPESATCIGAAAALRESGWIGPDESVVLFNCGGNRSSDSEKRPHLPVLSASEIDWDIIESGVMTAPAGT